MKMPHRRHSGRKSDVSLQRSTRLASWVMFWVAIVNASLGGLALLGLSFDWFYWFTAPFGAFGGLLFYHALAVETPLLALAAWAIAALYGFLGIRLRQDSWAAAGLAAGLYMADLVFLLMGSFSLGGEVPGGWVLLLLGGLLLCRGLLIGAMISGLNAFQDQPGARKTKAILMAILTWPLRFLSVTIGR
jgi:hypothetical protein